MPGLWGHTDLFAADAAHANAVRREQIRVLETSKTTGKPSLGFCRGVRVTYKSASTFSPSFVSGIRHFKSVFPKEADGGFVLFNGDVEPNAVFDDVRLANPLIGMF